MIVGIEVKQCNSGIFNSHAKYAVKIFKKFFMEDCQLIDTRVEYGINLTKKGERVPVNDTIQARSNSDFDVKRAPIKFYGNSHYSQSDCWIGLKLYVESHGMFSYLGLKFQINRSLGRHLNTGQQRLYEFYYLLPFDLWTFYLAKILFLKRCNSLFLKSTNSTKIFNRLQHSFQVW